MCQLPSFLEAWHRNHRALFLHSNPPTFHWLIPFQAPGPHLWRQSDSRGARNSFGLIRQQNTPQLPLYPSLTGLNFHHFPLIFPPHYIKKQWAIPRLCLILAGLFGNLQAVAGNDMAFHPHSGMIKLQHGWEEEADNGAFVLYA